MFLSTVVVPDSDAELDGDDDAATSVPSPDSDTQLPAQRLHGYDSLQNRDAFLALKARAWPAPPAPPALLEKWRPLADSNLYKGPLPTGATVNVLAEIWTTLDTFPAEWKTRTLALLKEAFPEYAHDGWDLANILLHETYLWAVIPEEGNQFCCVEAFSGFGNLRRSMAHKTGLPSLGIDLLYHPDHDFTTPQGVRTAIMAGRMLMISGLYWMGIECKTWIWISRSSTKRSHENPDGAADKSMRVMKANAMRDTAAIIMLLSFWSGKHFTVEQPGSSLIDSSCVFKAALKAASGRTARCDHGAYGTKCEAKKPLKLMGTPPWLPSMTKKATDSARRHKLATSKDGRVTGKKEELKDSQKYSEGFTNEIAEKHAAYLLERTSCCTPWAA